MSSFKDNDGNLMQHWVLRELLAVARKYTTRLTFIDAHSMAPTAIQRTEKNANRRRNFDSVLENLPGQGSSYEQAWQSLSPERGTYPNSANFVTHIWSPRSVCSLLLCERDEQTVSLLRSWAVKHSDIEIEIAAGDWRTRFDRALPKQEGLVFISFDPYMFNRHRRKENPGNMYPAAAAEHRRHPPSNPDSLPPGKGWKCRTPDQERVGEAATDRCSSEHAGRHGHGSVWRS